MAKVYLSLGSNLGDKAHHLRFAVEQIQKQIGPVVALSAFLVTEPWGFNSSNTFLNAAAVVETTLLATDVLHLTQQIEREMGRATKSNGHSYSDRVIDIDLLMYDDLVMHTPELILPHPLMHKRRFVLDPLKEIVPEAMHPVLGKRIKEL